MKTYIDVSQWQGVIDWDTVKPHIDGAILRAGYGKNHIDPQFVRNVTECNRLGIPCGAYWFSYVKSVDEARAEAKYLLAAVKPYRMELPLCYDFEYDSADNATAQGVTVTKELATSFAMAFLSKIEAGGFWALNYANPDFLSRMYDESLTKRFGLWLAAWKLSSSSDLSKPPRKCDVWQWGKTDIPGISGAVDTDESYVDFATIIRQKGLNNLKPENPAQDVPDPPDGTEPAQNPKALAWVKNQGLCGDVDAAAPVTWDKLAAVLYKLHGPDDNKTVSGLLTD